jgi:hypothetical protein
MTSVGDGPLQLQCQHSKLFDRPAASENGPLQLQCQHSETFDRPAASDNGPLQLRCQHSNTFDRPAAPENDLCSCSASTAKLSIGRQPTGSVLALFFRVSEPLRVAFWHVSLMNPCWQCSGSVWLRFPCCMNPYGQCSGT